MSASNNREPRGFILYFPISTEPTVSVETDVCYSKITRVNSKDGIPAFGPVNFEGSVPSACETDVVGNNEQGTSSTVSEKNNNIDPIITDPEILFTNPMGFESSTTGEFWYSGVFSCSFGYLAKEMA